MAAVGKQLFEPMFPAIFIEFDAGAGAGGGAGGAGAAVEEAGAACGL